MCISEIQCKRIHKIEVPRAKSQRVLSKTLFLIAKTWTYQCPSPWEHDKAIIKQNMDIKIYFQFIKETRDAEQFIEYTPCARRTICETYFPGNLIIFVNAWRSRKDTHTFLTVFSGEKNQLRKIMEFYIKYDWIFKIIHHVYIYNHIKNSFMGK